MQTRCRRSARGQREGELETGSQSPVSHYHSHHLDEALVPQRAERERGKGWWDEREDCGMNGMRKAYQHLSQCVHVCNCVCCTFYSMQLTLSVMELFLIMWRNNKQDEQEIKGFG